MSAILTKDYIICGESCRKVISMVLIGLSRLHGLHEEMELWSGSTPELRKGFISYEILKKNEGKKYIPFQGSNAIEQVVRVLHSTEDPTGLLYRFKIILGYYYISQGRVVHLKRDIYRMHLKGIRKGAIASLSLEKGLSRTGYNELMSRIIDKARESSWESKLIYASFPDELNSCI